MVTLYYESSFAHHGVKGQKWGVRRYQNPDGTLTAKGKKRRKGYEESNNPDAKFAGKVAVNATGTAAVNTAFEFGKKHLSDTIQKSIRLHDETANNHLGHRIPNPSDSDFEAYKYLGKSLSGGSDMYVRGTSAYANQLKGYMQMHVDIIDKASGYLDVLKVGQGVYNAVKGVKLAKDIYDYHNYKKSKKS